MCSVTHTKKKQKTLSNCLFSPFGSSPLVCRSAFKFTSVNLVITRGGEKSSHKIAAKFYTSNYEFYSLFLYAISICFLEDCVILTSAI